MIVGSLLLILVAVGLLVAGVLSGSNALIICSIAVVVLAAIVLVIGVKQSTAAVREPVDDDEGEDDAGDYPAEAGGYAEGGFADTRLRLRQDRRTLMVAEDPTVTASRRGTRVPAADETQVMTAVDDQPQYGPIPAQTGTVSDDRGHRRPAYPETPYEPAGQTREFQAVAAEEVAVAVDDDPPDEPSAQIVSPANAARVAMLTTDVLVVDGRPRYHVSGCLHLHGRDSEPLPVGEAVELGFTPCGLCEPDSALLADARRV